MKSLKLSISLVLLAFIVACAPKEKSFFDKLELKDLEGNEITLADLDGKMAFVNFWATTCKPCLKEMPSIENAKNILEKEGYKFIAVSNEELTRMKGFIDRFDYTFQFAQFPAGLESLNIYALPASYIIDTDGSVLYEHLGAKEWDDDENMELFRSYLND
jgi:peroxiredoxin